MPDRTPIETTNLDRYGHDALPWSRPRDLLVARPPQPEHSFFLSTTGPDGRPHVAGVGVMWHDGDLSFNSAPSAGPPPWDFYQFRFTTGFGVATKEPAGGTRWRFG